MTVSHSRSRLSRVSANSAAECTENGHMLWLIPWRGKFPERNTALAHASCVIPARLRAPRQSTRNIPPPPFAPTPESSDNTFRRPHTGASVWNQRR